MTREGTITPEERLRLRDELRSSMSGLEGVTLADQYPTVTAGARRRAGRDPAFDKTRLLTLVEVDGVLFWEHGAGQAVATAGLRRGMRGSGARGEIVERVRVDELEPSKIGKYLSDLDARLTPDRGLRRWNGTQLVPLGPGEAPAASGKILLLIHGTFSKSDMFFTQLGQTDEGKDLLGRAKEKYDQILAFDHPTTSVSPLLNAIDLSRAFAQSTAAVDLLCHSRGGLVGRWWLEAFDRQPQAKRRAVFVGSPLAGTSLASPPRIRSLLSWFTNLNRVLAGGASAAAAVVPFMTVVSGLLRFTALTTSVVSRTPLTDAIIAMVPGIAAMSKVSNNFELNRLNVEDHPHRQYFVVRSDFQTDRPGWKFWNYFVNPAAKIGDAAADLLFAEKNDLVVDTASMTYLSKTAEVPQSRILDFDERAEVHHTNYFLQKKTLDFIASKLEI